MHEYILGPRHSHACGIWRDANVTSTGNVTDLIIVAGGTDGNGEHLSTLESYDLLANSGIWQSMNPVGPNIPISNFGSSAHSIATFGPTEFIVQGGTGSTSRSHGDRENRFFWRSGREQIIRRGGTMARNRVSWIKFYVDKII